MNEGTFVSTPMVRGKCIQKLPVDGRENKQCNQTQGKCIVNMNAPEVDCCYRSFRRKQLTLNATRPRPIQGKCTHSDAPVEMGALRENIPFLPDGLVIKKRFDDGKDYCGIARWNGTYYTITYFDGDTEELDTDEVSLLLVNETELMD